MSKLTSLALLFCLLSNSAWAAPSLLHKGDPAPFDGLLFNTEDSNSLRNTELELGLSKKQYSITLQENELLNGQLVRYQNQTDKLSKDLVESRDRTISSPIVAFLAGAAVAILINFGLKK